MTLCRLVLFLLVLMTAPLRAEDARTFIKFGWCCTIHGSAHWTIWSDDIMEYSGQYSGALPDMPGWKWVNRKVEFGKARFRNEGAYARARAVADAALADPVLLKGPPAFGASCVDFGTDEFYLTGGETPDYAASECIPSRYAKHINQLSADLTEAIEADQVMPKP